MKTSAFSFGGLHVLLVLHTDIAGQRLVQSMGEANLSYYGSPGFFLYRQTERLDRGQQENMEESEVKEHHPIHKIEVHERVEENVTSSYSDDERSHS